MVNSTLHVGIPLGSSSLWIDKRILKGKIATAATQSLFPSVTIINAWVESKFYWSITVPGMFHGVEVWQLLNTEITRFEKAHTQMGKSLEGLPQFTADIAVLAIMGWVSLQAWVDKCRLLFLWKLLFFDSNHIYRKMTVGKVVYIRSTFNNRFKNRPISTLYEMVCKYGLAEHILNMIYGSGLGKLTWKKVVKTAV